MGGNRYILAFSFFVFYMATANPLEDKKTSDTPIEAHNKCGTTDSEYKFHANTHACYKFHTDVATWEEAEATCAREGGHIAVFNSLEDRRFFTGYFPLKPSLAWFSRANESSEGQSANKEQNCVAMNQAGDSLIVSCNIRNFFYCVKDPNSQSLPTTATKGRTKLETTETVPVADGGACYPSPCGPHSECRFINGEPVCSCSTGYTGSPPSCRPECTISSDCLPDQACSNNKCTKPCPGACGVEAICEVKNHTLVCTCPISYTGDPFLKCIKPFEQESFTPCYPSPCGPNSRCREYLGLAVCSCIQGYIGSPPNCKTECNINSDCPSHKDCINKKCVDTCVGACGINAQCNVLTHSLSCVCLSGFTGDPFSECHRMTPDQVETPCQPAPCGANAICKEQNGTTSCSCLQDYSGNPYVGCMVFED